MIVELMVIVALALLNGVFSGAEIAVLSVRKTRLNELIEQKRAGALALKKLRDLPERFFATVQIGITVIGAAAGAFGGSTLTARVAPAVASVHVLAPYARELAFALVVTMISYLSLVLGELVPKSLALRAAERYGLLVAPALLGLAWIARPIVWFLTLTSNAVLRVFGDRTSFTEARVSPEELQQLLDEASKTGSLDPAVSEIASRALDFGRLTASDVMVPRAQMVALPRTVAFDKLKELVLEGGHMRMPVYEDTIDQIVGYIYAKDVTALALEKDLLRVDDIIREATFVPEGMPAIDLLRMMQDKRRHQVIVVDEAGGVAGLVTMEDLVEEFVGDILSEYDRAALTLEADNVVTAIGSAPLRDVDRAIGTDLADLYDATTVAGLCMHLAKAVPPRGTLLYAGGVKLEVLQATRQRVGHVRIARPKS